MSRYSQKATSGNKARALPQRLRATKPVQKYLEGKFGDALGDAYEAMTALVKSMTVSDLVSRAHKL
jgi:hypothetical protein